MGWLNPHDTRWCSPVGSCFKNPANYPVTHTFKKTTIVQERIQLIARRKARRQKKCDEHVAMAEELFNDRQTLFSTMLSMIMTLLRIPSTVVFTHCGRKFMTPFQGGDAHGGQAMLVFGSPQPTTFWEIVARFLAVG